MTNLTGNIGRLLWRRRPDQKDGEHCRTRRATKRLHVALSGLLSGVLVVVMGVGPALAASGPSGASSAGTAPGLSVFTGLDGWIKAYGLAGAPVAVGLGGLLFAVEHHQQRTGNAVRAKGYIFAACAGLIVISLAGTISGAANLLAR